MRALLLVGGRATRLRPLTLTTPKAMTPLLGRPFLEHVLAWLARHDIHDVTLLLGFLPDPIRDHFGDGSNHDVTLRYVQEREPLGSGGAIKQIERELTEPFFALNGDIFTDLNLSAMRAAHAAAGAEVTMSLQPVADPSLYGVVACDAQGWIAHFVEKPARGQEPSNLINAGTWLFEPAAVRRIRPHAFTMVERDLFPVLAREGRLYGFISDCYWMDAGTPDRYLQLHRDLLTGVAATALGLGRRPGWPGLTVAPEVADRRALDPPVVDAAGAVEGPVTLGTGTRISARAAVIGPASLGEDVSIEEGAHVADSVLWDRCRIGAAAAVQGAILGRGCVVGAGARVLNAVLGDGVRVAPGTVVDGRTADPGTTIP